MWFWLILPGGFVLWLIARAQKPDEETPDNIDDVPDVSPISFLAAVTGMGTLGSEWWHSNTANKYGIDNTPSEQQKASLARLKEKLDRIYGPGSYTVIDGYRAPAVNVKLDQVQLQQFGKSNVAKNSLHQCPGDHAAVDVEFHDLTPQQAKDTADASGEFQECDIYPDHPDGSPDLHVHFGI